MWYIRLKMCQKFAEPNDYLRKLVTIKRIEEKKHQCSVEHKTCSIFYGCCIEPFMVDMNLFHLVRMRIIRSEGDFASETAVREVLLKAGAIAT